MTELSDRVSELKDITKAMDMRLRGYLKEIFTIFFNENPKIASVQWKQYTPGFNDGDPCLFKLCEPRIQLVGEDKVLSEDDDGLGSYDLRESHPEISEALGILQSALKLVEEQLENEYGSDSCITIDRTGKATIDDYDCGY